MTSIIKSDKILNQNNFYSINDSNNHYSEYIIQNFPARLFIHAKSVGKTLNLFTTMYLLNYSIQNEKSLFISCTINRVNTVLVLMIYSI